MTNLHTRILSSVVLLVILAGCAEEQAIGVPKALKEPNFKAPNINASPPIDEAQATAIARAAVAANDTWADSASFRTRSSGSGWHVIASPSSRPKGGQRYIDIDETGKVTKYSRGK